MMNQSPQIKKVHVHIQSSSIKYLCESWLQTKKEKVKPSTYAKYSFICHNYLEVYLTHYETGSLNSEIQQMITYLLQEGRSPGHPLSPKTVNDILIILKQVIEFGTIQGYWAEACQIDYPKMKKPVIRIMSTAEQKSLELYLQTNKQPVSLAIMIALCTGLRIGEICGLRWDDFNFISEYITIQRSVNRVQTSQWETGQKTKIMIDTPKTASSQRVIPIPSVLCDYIQSFPFHKSGYILTGKETCMEPRCLFAQYKKILKECGIDDYNFHTLRHTFATRCVEKGVNIKTLSEILGHANTQTTIDRYVHPTLEMKRDEINKVFSKNCSIETAL